MSRPAVVVLAGLNECLSLNVFTFEFHGKPHSQRGVMGREGAITCVLVIVADYGVSVQC